MTVSETSTTLDELHAELVERLSNRDGGNGAAPIDRAGTRGRILDAAIEIAAARGPEALTVRELAAAVGIKPPGLYSHFSGKEAILAEAMMKALADFLHYAKAPSSADEPVAQLEETIRRHVLYQLEHLNVTRANDLLLNSESLSHFLDPQDHELLVGVQRAYYRLVRSRIEAAATTPTRVDPRVTTFAVINMCDRVTTWYHPDGGLKPEDVAAYYWELVRGMLRL